MVAAKLHPYWEEAAHRIWRTHYVPGEGGWLLAFTPEFGDRLLPIRGDNRHSVSEYDPKRLTVVLRDTTDGKLYDTSMEAYYENADMRRNVMDDDWNEVSVATLSAYLYGSHHCPCHRKHDAKRAGAVVEDDDCEGSRFLIERIVSPTRPDLILYSETLSDDQLEAVLKMLSP